MIEVPPAPTLSVVGLRKSFGRADVLCGVDLEVKGGEFVGLMGPNGAGKSTLIKILDGLYSPTSGEIRVDGRAVESLRASGDVGFVHQDLGLVDSLSVVDNLRLGQPTLGRLGPLLDRRAERAEAGRALALVSLEVGVDTLVADLSPAEKTLLAVARTFSRGARILFVDEATSTLPPHDAQRVIATLAETVAAGMTVIMVSHKLGEILDGTTRVVLLLDGRIAADRPTAGLDRAALVQFLYAHESSRAAEVAGEEAVEPPARELGEVELRMAGARGGRCGPVDLEVSAGEVVGLTGLAGSGLHDVALLAAGAIKLSGGSVERRSGAAGLVPPHRETQGGFVDLSVRHNLTISALGRWGHPLRLLRGRAELTDAMTIADELALVPAGVETTFGQLSGGNKQKVVFGRALLRRPSLYVLCEPTRGVDVETRAAIYRLIHGLRDAGAAVLVVSSDSEDLFATCDRIGAVEDGLVGALRPVHLMNSADMEALL